MRIVITGGTGLIGRALSASLAHKGYEVIVLSRSPERKSGFPEGVKVVGWNGTSSNGWAQYADGAKAIVNLAGENLAGDNLLSIRWTKERKEGIRQSRVNAGKAVVEAVKLAVKKPEIVIQASAVGYYGPRDDAKLHEDTPAGNDFLANVCKEWEASTAAVEDLQVRQAVIRLGVVLSTQGGALPRQMLPFRLFAGGPIGNGKQGFPWIHITDVVGAIIFLIEAPQATGKFNLTAPNPLTNGQFGKVLGKVMGRPAFVPAPGFIFKIAFGEAATILLDGQMPLPTHLTELGYQFQYPSVHDALTALLRS